MAMVLQICVHFMLRCYYIAPARQLILLLLFYTSLYKPRSSFYMSAVSLS